MSSKYEIIHIPTGIPSKEDPSQNGVYTYAGDRHGIRWVRNGKFHRLDGPAYYNSKTGHERWCIDGVPHRLDGPAVTSADGGQSWYRNGKLHREGGPAVTRSSGSQEWYQNGKLHREDGPALILGLEFAPEWYLDDELIKVKNPNTAAFRARWERLVNEYCVRSVLEE